MTILWAFIILLVLGVIFGLGLGIASVVFKVKEDKRVEDVAKMLPNYNCGACGYPGCHGFAEAIVNKKAQKLSQCKVGKKETTFDPIIAYLEEHPDEDGNKIDIKI